MSTKVFLALFALLALVIGVVFTLAADRTAGVNGAVIVLVFGVVLASIRANTRRRQRDRHSIVP